MKAPRRPGRFMGRSTPLTVPYYAFLRRRTAPAPPIPARGEQGHGDRRGDRGGRAAAVGIHAAVRTIALAGRVDPELRGAGAGLRATLGVGAEPERGDFLVGQVTAERQREGVGVPVVV